MLSFDPSYLIEWKLPVGYPCLTGTWLLTARWWTPPPPSFGLISFLDPAMDQFWLDPLEDSEPPLEPQSSETLDQVNHLIKPLHENFLQNLIILTCNIIVAWSFLNTFFSSPGGASLARKAGIRALLSRRRTFEISEPQPAQSIFSIEVHHNGVHNYIDGYMSGLNTASWDPVFWFIHSFFQLLWVAFRNGQRANGINPERDYPRGVRVPAGHEFYQRMNFMPFMRRITNLEGLSNRYDRIVQYAPMPRCPACGGSPFLVCLRGVCVSRSSRRAPVFFRGKRSAGTSGDQLADENVNPNTTNLIQSNEAALSTLNKPYQNTFMIDGKIDEDAWAYIPIRVLYERPKGFNFHTTSPGATKRDMYDPENFKNEAKRIGLHNEVQYKQQCTPSGSGAAKVFVQSNGLNYAGKYKDYAIVDERQPVTSAITYVGFKKPSTSDSEVILTAYDTCGRICRPACPVYGHHRESYRACSGSFRISSKSPLMFSQNYGSAVSSTWNVREMEPGCKSSQSLPITFVCDHQNSWPWESKLW